MVQFYLHLFLTEVGVTFEVHEESYIQEVSHEKDHPHINYTQLPCWMRCVLYVTLKYRRKAKNFLISS